MKEEEEGRKGGREGGIERGRGREGERERGRRKGGRRKGGKGEKEEEEGMIVTVKGCTHAHTPLLFDERVVMAGRCLS